MIIIVSLTLLFYLFLPFLLTRNCFSVNQWKVLALMSPNAEQSVLRGYSCIQSFQMTDDFHRLGAIINAPRKCSRASIFIFSKRLPSFRCLCSLLTFICRNQFVLLHLNESFCQSERLAHADCVDITLKWQKKYPPFSLCVGILF